MTVINDNLENPNNLEWSLVATAKAISAMSTSYIDQYNNNQKITNVDIKSKE